MGHSAYVFPSGSTIQANLFGPSLPIHECAQYGFRRLELVDLPRSSWPIITARASPLLRQPFSSVTANYFLSDRSPRQGLNTRLPPQKWATYFPLLSLRCSPFHFWRIALRLRPTFRRSFSRLGCAFFAVTSKSSSDIRLKRAPSASPGHPRDLPDKNTDPAAGDNFLSFDNGVDATLERVGVANCFSPL